MTSERPAHRDPQLFIFNVSKAGCRHTCDTADAPHLFLPSFASALESAIARESESHTSARENNNNSGSERVIVQGAIYGPEGASIFIDTEDDKWERVVGIGRREDIERRLEAKVLDVAKKTLAQDVQVGSGAQNVVSIFKVGKAPQQHIVQQRAGDDDAEAEQPLLKAFVDAIYSLINQGARVEAAMYGAEEGAKIFVSED